MSAQAARRMSPREPAPGFMAFAADDATRAVMTDAAERAGFGAPSVIAGDVAHAAASLAEIPTPDVLVIDLDSDIPPAMAVEHLAAVCDPGAHVVFVGSVNDVTLYRELIALGVADYLVKPLSVEALIQAMQKPAPEPEPQIQAVQAEGLRIGVTGARGGAGATTVAVSLAWLFSEQMGLKTALVDIDVTYGTVALNLDLEPGRGLADAMENPARVDDLFIERATLAFSESLGVLASEMDPAGPQTQPDAPARLAEHLQQAFGAVVLDLPRGALAHEATVKSLDRLVIVTEPTLAGLRDAVRLKTLALAAGLDAAALTVIVNRAGMLPKGELDAKALTAGGQLTVDWTLPFDAKAAGTAMADAKPLAQVAAKGKIGKALKAVAGHLAPATDAEPRGALARWFKGGK